MAAGHVISQPPRVLTADSEGTLQLWDAERGTRLRRQECGGDVKQVFLLPGGKRALLALGDGRIVLWDLGILRAVVNFCPVGTDVATVELSPHGRLAAAAIKGSGEPDEPEGLVRCWDVATGRVCAEFDASLPAYLLTFSPAEDMLAVVLRGVSAEAQRQTLNELELEPMEPCENLPQGATVEVWVLRPVPSRLWCKTYGIRRTDEDVYMHTDQQLIAICFLDEHRLRAELCDPKEIIMWDSRTGDRVSLVWAEVQPQPPSRVSGRRDPAMHIGWAAYVQGPLGHLGRPQLGSDPSLKRQR